VTQFIGEKAETVYMKSCRKCVRLEFTTVNKYSRVLSIVFPDWRLSGWGRRFPRSGWGRVPSPHFDGTINFRNAPKQTQNPTQQLDQSTLFLTITNKRLKNKLQL
jgi:hypothetical protein